MRRETCESGRDRSTKYIPKGRVEGVVVLSTVSNTAPNTNTLEQQEQSRIKEHGRGS